MSIDLMPGFGAFTPASGGYETEADALFARFSVDPGATRKGHINTCIASLKSAGVWSKLDALWVFAAHDNDDALLNWVSSSHAMTLSGTPTFTTDAGYECTAAAYLTTVSTLNTYTYYAQDSAHLGIWVTNNNGGDAGRIGSAGGAGINMYPYFADTNVYARINDASESSGIATVATSVGFTLGNRSSSTAREAYRNGSSLGTYGSVASQAVLTSALIIIGSGASLNTAVASVGGSLNSTEQGDFYNALNTLKTAIGW